MKRAEIFLMSINKMKFKLSKCVIAILVIVVLVYLLRHKKKSAPATGNDGKYTIYGSEACPWTVKALDLAKKLGHAFDFVDCKSQKCPSFVDGFPTYKNHSSGKVHSGYHEDPYSI